MSLSMKKKKSIPKEVTEVATWLIIRQDYIRKLDLIFRQSQEFSHRMINFHYNLRILGLFCEITLRML